MSTNLAENKQKVLPDARNVTVRAKSALSGRENMSKIGVEYAISPRKHRKSAISRHMNGVAGIAADKITFRDYVINQINHIPKRVQYGVTGIVALIALVLSWQTFGDALGNYTRDLKIEKPFGIAIVDFGEKGANNRIYESSEASDISQWLYSSLQTSYQQFGVAEVKDTVQIIHRTSAEAVGQARKFAPITKTDAAAQCNAAKDAAHNLNAKMLVYGTLDKSNQVTESASLEISFYISPEFQKWLSVKNIQLGSDNDSVECLSMGEMLSVKLPLSDGVASTATANEVIPNAVSRIMNLSSLPLWQRQLIHGTCSGIWYK